MTWYKHKHEVEKLENKVSVLQSIRFSVWPRVQVSRVSVTESKCLCNRGDLFIRPEKRNKEKKEVTLNDSQPEA